MEVVDPDLDGHIEALEAVDGCEGAGIMPGETLGYRCKHCGQGDETASQIIHEQWCDHAGDHYDERAIADGETVTVGHVPELERHNRIDVIVAGYTDDHARSGAHAGESILFRCECGNAETLWEIRHDEDCDLAGRYS
jgi:hypothetical protein